MEHTIMQDNKFYFGAADLTNIIKRMIVGYRFHNLNKNPKAVVLPMVTEVDGVKVIYQKVTHKPEYIPVGEDITEEEAKEIEENIVAEAAMEAEIGAAEEAIAETNIEAAKAAMEVVVEEEPTEQGTDKAGNSDS